MSWRSRRNGIWAWPCTRSSRYIINAAGMLGAADAGSGWQHGAEMLRLFIWLHRRSFCLQSAARLCRSWQRVRHLKFEFYLVFCRHSNKPHFALPLCPVCPSVCPRGLLTQNQKDTRRRTKIGGHFLPGPGRSNEGTNFQFKTSKLKVVKAQRRTAAFAYGGTWHADICCFNVIYTDVSLRNFHTVYCATFFTLFLFKYRICVALQVVAWRLVCNCVCTVKVIEWCTMACIYGLGDQSP